MNSVQLGTSKPIYRASPTTADVSTVQDGPACLGGCLLGDVHRDPCVGCIDSLTALQDPLYADPRMRQVSLAIGNEVPVPPSMDDTPGNGNPGEGGLVCPWLSSSRSA